MSTIIEPGDTGALILQRFDQRQAAPFIYKSVSQETRAAYTRGLREFFAFVEQLHPSEITPAHVQAYRDVLMSRGRKATTVSTRLSIVRAFFGYLHAGGHIPINPASTKLVKPPALGESHAGRALTKKEVRNLLAGPDREKPEGARDYALMLTMLRLSLRLAEVVSLRRSSIVWDRRWKLCCKIKGGREEEWPLPEDVHKAIEVYLRLDAARRALVHSDGPEAPLFQPISNYRTLVFDKALSRRHVERIVARWGDYTGVGHVTPHDLRRTVVTHLLEDGYSYRDVQMVTKHRDPKTVQKYDRARENLDRNPVNTFSYDEK
jgi:site-specific recombinase XerD